MLSVHALAAALRTGKHVCALSMLTNERLQHMCFLKQVDWDPELPLRFLALRKALLRIRNASKKVAWMLRRRDGQRLHLVDRLVHRACGKDYMAVSAVELGCNSCHNSCHSYTGGAQKTLGVLVTYEHWSPGQGSITAVLPMQSQDGKPDHMAGCALTAEDVTRYNAYLRLVADMRTLHADMPQEWQHHPAMRFTWYRRRIVRIVVSRHFLELQSLRWWSLPFVHQLIQNNGSFRKNLVRPCFLPTLRLMLDYMGKHHGTHSLLFNEDDWI